MNRVDLIELNRLLKRDLVGKSACLNCDHDDVVWDDDMNVMWCNHCQDDANTYRTPDTDEQRPLTDGRVKDTLTGEVLDDTCTSIHDFPNDLGSNKGF